MGQCTCANPSRKIEEWKLLRMNRHDRNGKGISPKPETNIRHKNYRKFSKNTEIWCEMKRNHFEWKKRHTKSIVPFSEFVFDDETTTKRKKQKTESFKFKFNVISLYNFAVHYQFKFVSFLSHFFSFKYIVYIFLFIVLPISNMYGFAIAWYFFIHFYSDCVFFARAIRSVRWALLLLLLFRIRSSGKSSRS